MGNEKPEITREVKPDGSIVLLKSRKPETPGLTRWTPGTRSGGAVLHSPSPSVKNIPGKGKSVFPVTPPSVYRPIVDLTKKQVYIHPQAWWDVQFLVRSCPFEISGLGIVDTVPDGLMISKIYLLKQSGGGAHTELDPEAIAELMMEIDKAGIDTGKLRFWWHSHPSGTGTPGPSGRDVETFASFGRGAAGIAPDWYINAIFNHGGGQYWRMDIYRPVRTAIEIAPAMWHPSFGSIDWEKEMKEKITRSGGGSILMGGQGGSYYDWDGFTGME